MPQMDSEEIAIMHRYHAWLLMWANIWWNREMDQLYYNRDKPFQTDSKYLRIRTLLHEHFGDNKKVNKWILKRNPLLGDVRPWDMVLFGGQDKLLQFIEHQKAQNEIHLS